jgi:hypothetical protein
MTLRILFGEAARTCVAVRPIGTITPPTRTMQAKRPPRESALGHRVRAPASAGQVLAVHRPVHAYPVPYPKVHA